MNIGQIIAEALILVPHDVPQADQIVWLNAINQDFFNVVKIPKITKFPCIAAQEEYTLPVDVRQKNIDKVLVGMFQHKSLESDNITPAQNAYSFDDQTHKLTIYPAPYTVMQGILRYRRIATTNFLASDLTLSPDAPEEYHFSFIPALASYIANTQDDSIKAGNYEAQYRSVWNAAVQQYQGSVDV